MLWPDYLESAERDLLTAAPEQLDHITGHAALLLAACGAPAECDRLIRHWQRTTERPASALATDAVTARAWAMLLSTRERRPDWAAALVPLDLDDAARAHREHLRRGQPPLPGGGSAGAGVISGIAAMLGDDPAPDPLRALAAEAEDLAAAGATQRARVLIEHWAHKASSQARPDLSMLAGCRHLAPLLAADALAAPLGVTDEWAAECTGRLIAAVRARSPAERPEGDWPDLLARIIDLRTCADERAGTPPPATEDDILAAERRLATRLPTDYRRFLLCSDGLGADVVFPRLLRAAELTRAPGGEIALSEQDAEYATIVLVPGARGWRVAERDAVLGTTVHPSFRALLEHHLALLESGR